MFNEVPVIAVASGGPLETVLHGKTGYLCEQVYELVVDGKQTDDSHSLYVFMLYRPETHLQNRCFGLLTVMDLPMVLVLMSMHPVSHSCPCVRCWGSKDVLM